MSILDRLFDSYANFLGRTMLTPFTREYEDREIVRTEDLIRSPYRVMENLPGVSSIKYVGSPTWDNRNFENGHSQFKSWPVLANLHLK